MSEQNLWPFPAVEGGEELDINAIFGGGTASSTNPFDQPQNTVTTAQPAPAQSPAPQAGTIQPVPSQQPAPTPQPQESPAPSVEAPNPIEAAFAQKTMENAKKSLLEKPPVFCHKNVKETIEDTEMTFEDLRIRKSEDFSDLEDGKCVSWSVDYGGIRKEIKDPKGTTIRAIKESIERSREFLEALKKAKDKNPDCLIKPRVTMKTKGIAAYRGVFRSLEEARASDKVICLIPAEDGQFYELRKSEQGEFIAPKNHVSEFEQIRAGFTPALPRIPLSLISTITSFFRAFMEDGEEYEALALIYWDKQEEAFFAYVPHQTVTKEGITADLRDCPYDDDPRYIRYADIHSHNSMDAFFSMKDDQDERDTSLYLVMGHLENFFPDIKARIFCGGTHVPIDPSDVMEGLEATYLPEWLDHVKRGRERPVGKRFPALLGGLL